MIRRVIKWLRFVHIFYFIKYMYLISKLDVYMKQVLYGINDIAFFLFLWHIFAHLFFVFDQVQICQKVNLIKRPLG